MTGAMIKVPEDQQSQGDEVLVEMFGNFMQTNLAQNRLRSFVAQGMQHSPPPPPQGPPMNGAGAAGAAMMVPGGAPMMAPAGVAPPPPPQQQQPQQRMMPQRLQ